MKRIILAAVVLLAVVAVMLATCSRSGGTPPEESYPPEPTPSPTAAPTAVPSPTASPTPSPYAGFINPLTGLPAETDVSKNRPYAIMLNNRQIAQPLLGVSMADVIYEAPVEGGITRMLAIFQDGISGVGVIGSVRSARLYYIDIAQGYDAVFIHAGGSPQAYSALQSRKITSLDGVNGSRQDIFYRDAARRKAMGYEHSLVTTGERIAKYLPTYNFRLEHEDGYAFAAKFDPDAAAPGADLGERVKIAFSSIKSTTLEYRTDTGLYGVSQFNGVVKDGDDGAELLVANALILRAPIGQIAGDTEGRLDVSLTGRGKGWFYCGGTRCAIEWSKKDADSPFVYTLENGKSLTFRTGKTYVAVVALDAAIT